MPHRPDRPYLRAVIAALAAVAVIVPACASEQLSCLELEAEAVIAARDYDVAEVGSTEEAEAKARFDQLVGEQINLEC